MGRSRSEKGPHRQHVKIKCATMIQLRRLDLHAECPGNVTIWQMYADKKVVDLGISATH